MKFYFSKKLEIEDFDGFHLIQDNIGTGFENPWDDYDYVVTFQVYKVAASKKEKIGNARVLAKGQRNTSEYFLKHGAGTHNENIVDISRLTDPSIIVSLPKNISFYEKLEKLMLKNDALLYLKTICDASYYREKYSDFMNWPGFKQAVLRDGLIADAMIEKGRLIASGKYVIKNDFLINVTPDPEKFSPITLGFNNSANLDSTRINLLIGRNGVGKTSILLNLVDLISGVRENEEKWPYFNKLLVVAYSPFEKFPTKNQLIRELNKKNGYFEKNDELTQDEQKNYELQKTINVNEYSYVGFKNENEEFSLYWPKIHSARSLLEIIEKDNAGRIWGDADRFDILFDTFSLCLKFDTMALRLQSGELISFSKSFRSEYNDSTQFDYQSGISFWKNGKEINLSSGQIIYSYMLPCLVAEIEKESLIIIDEPELYLHPALEVGLIRMLKSLLKKNKSYAIIATHSAVMAREVPSRAINIFKFEDGMTENQPPTFETFGESLDLIIGESFEDRLIGKSYEEEINVVLKTYDSFEKAVAELSPKIGDQALSYLMRKRNSQDNDLVRFEEL